MTFKIRRTDIFYIILFISLFLIFLYGRLMMLSQAISFPFLCIGALADASLFSVISLLLRGKWRYIALFIPALVCMLLLANIIYFKNFGDLIPGSGYALESVFDPRIISAIGNSFSYSMLFPIVCILSPAIFLIKYRAEIIPQKTGKPLVIAFITATVTFWGLSYAGSFRRTGIYIKEKNPGMIMRSLFSMQSTDWIFYLDNHNFTGYLIRYALGTRHIKLSAENISDIQKTFRAKFGSNSGIKARPKDNLIMIIVESLPSKAIESDDCATVSPNLYNLINDSTTITMKECKVLAGYGRSSDAQFMYNTGLLPLRNEALVSNYASNNYPSLAKALRRISIEIIGENKRLWNHAATSQSYGFSELVDNIANNVKDQDSIILNFAGRRIKSVDKPFCLLISTLSMHDPYMTPEVSHADISFNHTDSRDREYFQRLHHFDKALGRFIDELKQDKKFDNSLIVILGDHEIRQGTVPSYLDDNRVPFIIVNSGVSASEVRSREITQLDVFPTILDLMNTRCQYFGVPYTGLGRSIFLPPAIRSHPADKDYEISDLIIRSNP